MDEILTEYKRSWTCKRHETNMEIMINLQENLNLKEQNPPTCVFNLYEMFLQTSVTKIIEPRANNRLTSSHFIYLL